MSFVNPFDAAPAPATIITPPGPIGVVDLPIETLGANGPTGTNVSPRAANDIDELPFSFDQEQRLLMKMNEQQGKTIEELMTRIKVLEKELLEKPVPPICYIKCAHCYESE